MSTTATFKIHGMHCDSCARIIEQNLSGMAGVTSVKVNKKTDSGEVVFDDAKVTEKELAEAIKMAGDYEVEVVMPLNASAASNSQTNASADDSARNGDKSRDMFVWGLLVGFSVISLLVNIILVYKLLS